MHFSATKGDSGSKLGKITIVTALHGIVALALLNLRVIVPEAPPLPPITLTEVIKPKILPKIELPDLNTKPQVTPPIVVPVTETVRLDTPPDVVRAVVVSEPVPPAVGPVVIAPPVPPTVIPGKRTEAIRNAVLADANSCGKPDYPARSARNGDTGTVTLALLVGVDGRVASSKVQKSSGFRDLDTAAVAALSLCKFKPATTDGVAEQAWAQIAYVWTLDQ